MTQSDSPNLLSWESDGNGEGGQGNYDLALAVSPINENIVFVGGINIWKSVNGGISWNPEGGADISNTYWSGWGDEYVHADQHIFKYNPSNNVLFSGNDGGLYKTENNGQSWTDISDGLQQHNFTKSVFLKLIMDYYLEEHKTMEH